MNVLIIGGNRFVGKKLASKLCKKHNVSVLNRNGTGPDGCNKIKFDRNNSLTIENNFDLVIDFCLFKPHQAKLLKDFILPNQKYIFISSGTAYKDNNNFHYSEDMDVGGLSFFGEYGVEKAECENIVSSFNKYIIVRPPYIDGPESHRPRIKYYMNNILNGLEVHVHENGDKLMSFIMVDDMVDELSNMIENFNQYETNTSYNLSNDEVYTEVSLINEISSFLNKKAIIKTYGSDSPLPNVNHYILSPFKLGKKFSSIKKNLEKFLNAI